MSDVFISYARSTEARARQIAEALRALGYGVWRDDELPAHRDYSEVIEERLRAAKAVVVVWSAEAVKSQWVRAEAEIAREAGTLVQLNLDGAALPLPFNRVQCADLSAWTGDLEAPGWRKVAASIAELAGQAAQTAPTSIARPAAAASAERPSIAVASFGGQEEADFADGLVEEIVTALSRYPQLLVIDGRSGHGSRGEARSGMDIAKELGVRFIVDGGVRRAGDRLRISVKLIDSESGGQIWAEQFDGSTDDIFGVQAQVAISAAAQIAPAIEAPYLSRALALPADELTAFELFLRAVHLEREFTRQALEDAIVSVDLALERDPHFALALAFASQIRALLVLNAWATDPRQMTRAALELGRRAVNRAPDVPSVLANVATVLIWVGDDAKSADAMVERALARHPGSSLPWFASAWIKVFDGRPALAIEHWDTHLRLSPYSDLYAFVAGGLGIALTLLGRFDEAVARLHEALHMVPEQRIFRATLVAALAHNGRQDEAARMLGGLPTESLAILLGLLRRDTDRELIADGLRCAGAEV